MERLKRKTAEEQAKLEVANEMLCLADVTLLLSS